MTNEALSLMAYILHNNSKELPPKLYKALFDEKKLGTTVVDIFNKLKEFDIKVCLKNGKHFEADGFISQDYRDTMDTFKNRCQVAKYFGSFLYSCACAKMTKNDIFKGLYEYNTIWMAETLERLPEWRSSKYE